MINFWLTITSDNIIQSAIELDILEDMEVAFGFSILTVCKLRYMYFGLATAMLNFQLPLTSENILLIANELGILKNAQLAFEFRFYHV